MLKNLTYGNLVRILLIKRCNMQDKLVLWLSEEDRGPNKEPKLVPSFESSLNVNWGWLFHKKYDDVIFELKKKNGEIIMLPVGSEIIHDLELPQA